MTSVLESSRSSGGAGGQLKGKSKRRRRRRSKRKAENSGWVHTLLPRISHRLQERCNTQFGTRLDATDHRLSSQSETPHEKGSILSTFITPLKYLNPSAANMENEENLRVPKPQSMDQYQSPAVGIRTIQAAGECVKLHLCKQQAYTCIHLLHPCSDNLWNWKDWGLLPDMMQMGNK